jgi:hypothetical protein
MNWHAWQDGRCGMCGVSYKINPSHVTDHCHRTGFERGSLCRGCNVAEGRSYDSWWQAYRRRPPSVICQDVYLYNFGGEAHAQEWVLYILGERPPKGTPDAAAYLVSAADLIRHHHFDLISGKPLHPPHPNCPRWVLKSRTLVVRGPHRW